MRVSVTSRTAVYGPVRTVVWEGWSRKAPPYPDLWPFCELRPCLLLRRRYQLKSRHQPCLSPKPNLVVVLFSEAASRPEEAPTRDSGLLAAADLLSRSQIGR